MCYRNGFENCTSIMDCIVLFIERPKEMRARANTYSQYKHYNTVKYLVSLTPQGVISFVLKGWGGRTSDEHSGFLEPMSPGDVVLADGGLMWQTFWVLLMLEGKQQLHPAEIESSWGLGAVRVHLERVIGLVRNKCTILRGTIPITLCYSTPDGLTPLDKVLKVCCTLCIMFVFLGDNKTQESFYG